MMSKKEEDKLPFSISSTKNKLKDKLKGLQKLGWKEYLALIVLFMLLGGVFAYYQKSSQLDSLHQISQDNEAEKKEELTLDSSAQSQADNLNSSTEGQSEIGRAVSTIQNEKEENTKKESEKEPKEEEVTSLPQMSSESVTSQFDNLIMPLKGEITSRCEWYRDKTLDAWKYNPGINIKGEIGAPIKAVGQGEVKQVLRDDYKGITVIIEHNQIYSSLYSHLEKSRVKVGEKVNKKAVIANLGDSGAGEESRLHFEIIKEGKRVDPMDYFN